MMFECIWKNDSSFTYPVMKDEEYSSHFQHLLNNSFRFQTFHNWKKNLFRNILFEIVMKWLVNISSFERSETYRRWDIFIVTILQEYIPERDISVCISKWVKVNKYEERNMVFLAKTCKKSENRNYFDILRRYNYPR